MLFLFKSCDYEPQPFNTASVLGWLGFLFHAGALKVQGGAMVFPILILSFTTGMQDIFVK